MGSKLKSALQKVDLRFLESFVVSLIGNFRKIGASSIAYASSVLSVVSEVFFVHRETDIWLFKF